MLKRFTLEHWLRAVYIHRPPRYVENFTHDLLTNSMRRLKVRSLLVNRSKLYSLLGALSLALPVPGHCDTVTLPFASVQSLTGKINNTFQPMVAAGNALYTNYSGPGLPSTWTIPAGAVYLAADGAQGAFWMQNDAAESPNGYLFKGSFIIAQDGLEVGRDATLFVSKPTNWSGTLAAWRLYYIKSSESTLALLFIVGWDSSKNNPSAAMYKLPVVVNKAYDVVVSYDTARRMYWLSLDGVLEICEQMPSDYPLIGTQIVGSSGSANGHGTEFIVDNVIWRELPGLTAAKGCGVN